MDNAFLEQKIECGELVPGEFQDPCMESHNLRISDEFIRCMNCLAIRMLIQILRLDHEFFRFPCIIPIEECDILSGCLSQSAISPCSRKSGVRCPDQTDSRIFSRITLDDFRRFILASVIADDPFPVLIILRQNRTDRFLNEFLAVINRSDNGDFFVHHTWDMCDHC